MTGAGAVAPGVTVNQRPSSVASAAARSPSAAAGGTTSRPQASATARATPWFSAASTVQVA